MRRVVTASNTMDWNDDEEEDFLDSGDTPDLENVSLPSGFSHISAIDNLQLDMEQDLTEAASMAGDEPTSEHRPKLLKATPKIAPGQRDTQRGVVHTDNTSFLVFDTALRESRQSQFKLPWETQSSLLEWSVPYKLKLPNVGRWDVVHEGTGSSSSGVNIPQTTSWHRKRLMAARFVRTDDQLRDVVNRKARELILYHPEDTVLGDALMDKAGRLCSEAELSMSISDALAGKSVGTLLKRLTDYHRFGAWCIANSLGRPMNPAEGTMYRYMTFLRDGNASATSGKSFIKAVWFMHYHFGFKNLDLATAMSGRIRGVASILAAHKRPLTQAPVIPSDMLYRLEKLMDTVDNKRACILGFLLFCLFSSARFSDAARCHDLQLLREDHIVFLETGTLEFKTASEDKKNILLPILALGGGLYEFTWGTAWVDARRRERLDHKPFLMPGLSEVKGTWLDRRMTSAEGSVWLKEFIEETGVPQQEATKYSSHSLKSTLLNWTALCGILTMDERRAMGHHFDSRLAVPLTYSRDFLAQIHVKVYRMLDAIRKGMFDPEENRAARIARETQDLVDVGDEASSGSDIEEDEIAATERIPPMEPVERELREAMDPACYRNCRQHRISGVVHQLIDADTFYCGRRMSDRYTAPTFPQEESTLQTFCMQCQAAKV